MTERVPHTTLDVKSKNRRQYQMDLESKAERFRSMPPMIQLEPTSRCNLSCPICARSYYDRSRNPDGDMDEEVFSLITSLLAAADDVVLGGYGEPMLGQLFYSMLERSKLHFCRTTVITNGTLLDNSSCERLVDSGLDQLTASIDASSDEKMKSLRGIPLQSVVDGLMGLNEIKRRLRRLAPEIHLNFTCSVQNIGDLTALVEIAETMNVRQINVNLQKIYARKQRDDTLLLHREEARAEFSHAEDAARGRGIRLVLPTLEETGKVCRQPLEMLFVRWNGEVMGCCSAVFENDDYNFHIGSLLDADPVDLWNCEKMRRYRRAVFFGEEENLPKNCRACAFRNDNPESHWRFLDT